MSLIINYLREKRGLNISCYNENFIERRLKERLKERNISSYEDYVRLLEKDGREITSLLNSLFINVSKFFRNNITFELMSKEILPYVINKKLKKKDPLRIWSAGCAKGEETYSAAILIDDYLKKENLSININIFGTDIDETALESAEKGIYPPEAVENVKYGILKKYFKEKNGFFEVNEELKKYINFSSYDLADSKSYSPPEAIFGNFDLIMCRNVLIYFSAEYQKKIFHKLCRSLTKKGFLILGEFEEPFLHLSECFKSYNYYCRIYRKEEDVF